MGLSGGLEAGAFGWHSPVSSERPARSAEVGSKAKAAVRYRPWRPKSAEEGSGDLPGSYRDDFFACVGWRKSLKRMASPTRFELVLPP